MYFYLKTLLGNSTFAVQTTKNISATVIQTAEKVCKLVPVSPRDCQQPFKDHAGFCPLPKESINLISAASNAVSSNVTSATDFFYNLYQCGQNNTTAIYENLRNAAPEISAETLTELATQVGVKVEDLAKLLTDTGYECLKDLFSLVTCPSNPTPEDRNFWNWPWAIPVVLLTVGTCAAGIYGYCCYKKDSNDYRSLNP